MGRQAPHEPTPVGTLDELHDALTANLGEHRADNPWCTCNGAIAGRGTCHLAVIGTWLATEDPNIELTVSRSAASAIGVLTVAAVLGWALVVALAAALIR